MALYAFDGTGNEDQADNTFDTNVVDFFSAYVDPAKNTDPDKEFGSLYLKGIGRLATTTVGKGFSEAFGVGGHHRVHEAMKRLKNNRSRGDRAPSTGTSRIAGSLSRSAITSSICRSGAPSSPTIACTRA